MQVVGIVKEMEYARCHLWSHIFQILKVFQGKVGEFPQMANGYGQDLGRCLTHITDTQSEDQPVQRLLPGCLDRRLKIVNALLPKTLQCPDLIIGKPVDTRNILQKSKSIELPDIGIP